MKIKYKVSIPLEASPRYVKDGDAVIIDSSHHLYPALSPFALKTGYYEVLVGHTWYVVVVLGGTWCVNTPPLPSEAWVYDLNFRYFKSQKDFDVFKIIRHNAHKYGIKIPANVLGLYEQEKIFRDRLRNKLLRSRILKS